MKAALLTGIVCALFSLPLSAGADEASRPLPPTQVRASLQPLPSLPPAERASRRGILVLTIGGAVVATFVVLALSGFFKPKR